MLKLKFLWILLNIHSENFWKSVKKIQNIHSVPAASIFVHKCRVANAFFKCSCTVFRIHYSRLIVSSAIEQRKECGFDLNELKPTLFRLFAGIYICNIARPTNMQNNWRNNYRENHNSPALWYEYTDIWCIVSGVAALNVQ